MVNVHAVHYAPIPSFIGLEVYFAPCSDCGPLDYTARIFTSSAFVPPAPPAPTRFIMFSWTSQK